MSGKLYVGEIFSYICWSNIAAFTAIPRYVQNLVALLDDFKTLPNTIQSWICHLCPFSLSLSLSPFFSLFLTLSLSLSFSFSVSLSLSLLSPLCLSYLLFYHCYDGANPQYWVVLRFPHLSIPNHSPVFFSSFLLNASIELGLSTNPQNFKLERGTWRNKFNWISVKAVLKVQKFYVLCYFFQIHQDTK